MPRVLLVEDEVSIAETLIYALETEHFEVTHVTTAGAALEALNGACGSNGLSADMAFAILDVGLPDMSGFDLCREIRKSYSLPILFLTARDSEIDRILGLELGGDDYVTKPFSPREVCARVRAVLRRTTQGQMTSVDGGCGGGGSCRDAKRIWGDEELDEASKVILHDAEAMVIWYRGARLDLTAHEYKLLAALMTQPGRIFTREQLLEKAWDDPGSAMDRTVDAHIKSLRAKMRRVFPEGENLIQTRRGLGYTLDLLGG